jgi:hypothetical protein
MAGSVVQHELPPIVAHKLQQVRRAIRAYVWLEGLSALAITLAAAFWAGLAVDWLFEPPPHVRFVALVVVVAFALWCAYRTLFRRIFAPLPDASLAVLLERRFRHLQDHLLTAVDLAASDKRSTVLHPELVARTHDAAASAAADLQTNELLRHTPLMRLVAVALLLAATIPIFAVVAGDAFGFWLQRIALGTELWPRRVHLEVVGFPPDPSGRRTHKIAHDDDFEMFVHASTAHYVVPAEVQIRSRAADGGRGRDTMIRVGEAVPGRDDFQLFRYTFKNLTADMTFDVVGGDDRVDDLYLQVVDRPELVAMEIECVYPDYLGRPSRRLPVTGGMRIPEGTRLTLHAASTKPLTDVLVHSAR